jgi:ABC-type sugar transport system ATPase subunit
VISLSETTFEAVENILEIKDFSKSFPGVKALDKVSIEVREGEIHALLGENGSGKSTLTKCIVGAYKKDQGLLYFKGMERDFKSPIESFAEGLSVVYQERSLIPQLTILQNIMLGNEFSNKMGILNEKKARDLFREVSEQYQFNINPDLLVKNLGVAEQKLVEIIKALVRQSKLIIMDEPTASLSEDEIEHLFLIIAKLKEKGISVIYITHLLDEVFKITDRITILRDGKKVTTKKTNEMTKEEIINLMSGEVLQKKDDKIQNYTDKTAPFLRVKNLVYQTKLKGISFETYPGEVLGVTGLTGAGKSEMAKILFGAIKPDSGNIEINGENLHFKTPHDAIKRGISLVPEDRKTDGLNQIFEVYKNLSLPSLDKFTNRFGVVDTRKELKKTDEYQKKMNIKYANPFQKTEFLSGGNQQKIVLAKWLETSPKLLILDEATQGIDIRAKSEIHTIVRQLAEKGMSILFISSEIREVIGICDRILVLRDGRISGEFNHGVNSESVIKAMLGGSITDLDKVTEESQ